MKLCYVDESGNQDSDRCLVMVGIMVDAARLNRTRQEFGEIFDSVQQLFEEPLQELKASKMVFGRDRWRKIDPEKRKQLATYFCKWICDRKHSLLISAIDRSQFSAHKAGAPQAICDDIWTAGGLHIALQVQKANQGCSNNKGQTFLVFDENKQKADRLSEMLWSPPAWTDDYYGRTKKQERLDQLIDSAFTVKSHHAGLVQVAAPFAFLLRRCAEINDYSSPEEWDGERSFVSACVTALTARMLPVANRWPSKTASACAKWFTTLAPNSLKALGGKN